MELLLKRANEEPGDADGFRVLVDRLWPRGRKKADVRLITWVKEIATQHRAKEVVWSQSGTEETRGEKGNCRHHARCTEVFRDHFDLRGEGYITQ